MKYRGTFTRHWTVIYLWREAWLCVVAIYAMCVEQTTNVKYSLHHKICMLKRHITCRHLCRVVDKERNRVMQSSTKLLCSSLLVITITWPSNADGWKWSESAMILSAFENSHAAVFTLNVQFVRLAAERPTQIGDPTDQWRDWWNTAIVCPTQWRLPASAGWLLWIVDVDRPSVEAWRAPQTAQSTGSKSGLFRGHIVRLDERDILTPQVRRCVPGSVWRRAVLLQTSVQDASATPAGCDSYFRQ